MNFLSIILTSISLIIDKKGNEKILINEILKDLSKLIQNNDIKNVLTAIKLRKLSIVP